jgi:quinol monooxygenase YgiN
MLVVLARFNAKKGERDKVVKLARECIEITRKEAGCISYEMFAATENDTGLIFVERWESKEALKVHLKSEHLAKFSKEREPYQDGVRDIALDIALFESSPTTL